MATLSVSNSVNFVSGAQSVAGSSNNTYSITESSGMLFLTVSSSAAIDFGSITLPGLIYVKNLSTNGYVQLSTNGSVWFAELEPGESAIFRIVGTALYTRANIATAIAVGAFGEAPDSSSSSSSSSISSVSSNSSSSSLSSHH